MGKTCFLGESREVLHLKAEVAFCDATERVDRVYMLILENVSLCSHGMRLEQPIMVYPGVTVESTSEFHAPTGNGIKNFVAARQHLLRCGR